jgi:hypothetical protein
MERLRDLDFSSALPGPPGRPPLPRSPGAVWSISLVAVGLGLMVAMAGTGGFDTLAQRVALRFNPFGADPVERASEPEAAPLDLPAMNMHPASMHRPYFSRTIFTASEPDSTLLNQFHGLLGLFAKRQGVDDNFTIRVIDDRTHEPLEVYVLDDLRAAYRDGREMEWREVDRERRRVTRRLVDKYEARGVPTQAITVKWGRANQIDAAHERDAPYAEYEIRLAQYLGLSLLPTEIGTVETFNQDWLVSPVGARGRYQMMPWILRRSGINTYRLPTASDSWLRVREEWHPLLTLEPAFTLLRGYVNAVGHEIPGLSAYHSGPGNIYKIYRLFFTRSDDFTPQSTVVDAFMWGLTEGFDTVREASSFGGYSRGYVPSAYGALLATESRAVDTTRTLEVARVQLEPGAEATLGDLLAALDATGRAFDWGRKAEGSLYERFRAVNPHFDLPPSDDGELPRGGNVRFVPSVDGKAVRFFLPLGAPRALEKAGFSALDDAATFRFTHDTFGPPPEGQRTVWDERYDDLVDAIRDFGFTPSNRERLLRLHEKFVELAEQRPSHYRRMQLDIIRTHRRIWMSNPWAELSDAAMLATGRFRMPVQPPVEIPGLPPEARAADLSD